MKAYGQRQYTQTQVTTVDKGRLIILLYEGAIKYLRQAKECAGEGNIPGKSSHINRALDIIAELNQSLNMTDGGDISANLRKLYLFWTDHLIQGKIQKDSKNVDDVLRMLSSLLEAWNYVVSQPEPQLMAPVPEAAGLKAPLTI